MATFPNHMSSPSSMVSNATTLDLGIVGMFTRRWQLLLLFYCTDSCWVSFTFKQNINSETPLEECSDGISSFVLLSLYYYYHYYFHYCYYYYCASVKVPKRRCINAPFHTLQLLLLLFAIDIIIQIRCFKYTVCVLLFCKLAPFNCNVLG